MNDVKLSAVASSVPPLRLAAVASAGGHLIQLRRLEPLLEVYETRLFIAAGHAAASEHDDHVVIPDFSRSNAWVAPKVMYQLLRAFLRRRPDVVLTTGAAPGLMAVVIGRFLGARTIWIDSIANAERLSGSGRAAKFLAHHCLTQWPKVAEREGVGWIGNVL